MAKTFEITGIVTDEDTNKKTAWLAYGEGDCSMASLLSAQGDYKELLDAFIAKRKQRLADKMKGGK